MLELSSMRWSGFPFTIVFLAVLGAVSAAAPVDPGDPMNAPHGADVAAFDDLWNYDDPAATESVFRKLLPRVAALPDPSTALQLRTQIARTLGLQKKYGEAGALLDEVEQALPAAAPIVRIRYLLERGRLTSTSGDPAAARPLFEEAWEMGPGIGLDRFVVDAAHMVAIVAPEESRVWNERAMELAGRSSDPGARRWRGSLLNNLGWTCHDAGDYARALERFEEALVVRREQGQEPNIRAAQWCVARCLRSLGRLEEALAGQRSLEADAGEEGPDGYVLEEIAECLLAQGQDDDARPYFRRAFAALSEDSWLPESEPARLERIGRLGGS
jgi:tetratricopeptide (TPR) repeat protein